jgi:hypothetical protein
LTKHSLEHQQKNTFLTDEQSLKQKTNPTTNTAFSESLSRFDDSYEESESICGTRKKIKKTTLEKNSRVKSLIATTKFLEQETPEKTSERR